jgi:hypothetical protein
LIGLTADLIGEQKLVLQVCAAEEGIEVQNYIWRPLLVIELNRMAIRDPAFKIRINIQCQNCLLYVTYRPICPCDGIRIKESVAEFSHFVFILVNEI